MEINWTELGEFVKSVGIPFAILLVFVAPIAYALYRLITTQGPELVRKHNDFVDKVTAAGERNADSIAMMAAANTASQANHEATHTAIKEVIRGNRKFIERVAPDIAPTVTPHLDRAEQAIERAG